MRANQESRREAGAPLSGYTVNLFSSDEIAALMRVQEASCVKVVCETFESLRCEIYSMKLVLGGAWKYIVETFGSCEA